jgi:hypothetical protein
MSMPSPTAYQLYFASHHITSSDERARLERLFFSSIRLRNGTFKRTDRGRLDDLNALVEKFLPAERPLDVMDVAASSGVSTAEWLVSLERAGISCRLVAGDAVVDAFLISLCGRVRALVDRTGYMMQLDVAGKAVPIPPPRRRDRIRYLPLTLLMKTLTRALRPNLQKRPVHATQLFGCGAITCQSLRLISPGNDRVRQLDLIEDDILTGTSYPSRFHVVRAANILNLRYFDATTIERMLVNLRARLVPRGLLIVCRTDEVGTNNATLFTLTEGGRFEVLARLNAGSEITDIVVSLRSPVADEQTLDRS